MTKEQDHVTVMACPHCSGSGKVTSPPLPPGKWLPVWWTQWDGERVKAVAGSLSKTGKRLKVRYYVPGHGQIERSVSPKSVEPR